MGRNIKNARTGARIGAAAFAVGLSLTGPQALGIAGADTGEAASATDQSSAAPAQPKAAARRGEAKSGAASTGRSAARRANSAAAGRPVPARSHSASPVVSPAAAPAAPAGSNTSAPAPAVTSPTLIAALTPPAAAGAAGQASAPNSLPAAAAAAPATATAVATTPARVAARVAARAQAVASVNTRVRTLLDAVANLLTTLPGPTAEHLAGALLVLRRGLFNQAPSANPVQQSTDTTGRISGSLGAIDPEGDALTYTVATGPTAGTVTVDGTGHYVYTPGADFTGTDSFTVTVNAASTGKGANLLNPRGGHTTEVAVTVGAGAPSNPFADPNNLEDAAFLLKNTDAHLTVGHKLGKLTGTVTLNLPDSTPLAWLDQTGQDGKITVGELAADWEGIANAGDVMLGVNYTLDDGSAASVILHKVEASSDGSGQYTFTGTLTRDVKDPAGTNTYFDVIGEEYKAAYENFLDHVANNIGKGTLSLDISNAKVTLDTFSVADYKHILDGATNHGITPGAATDSPAAASDVIATSSIASAVAENPGVVSIVKIGSAIAFAQRDGSIQLVNSGGGITLLQNSGWNSDVADMVAWGDKLVVGLTNGAIEQWNPGDSKKPGDPGSWTEIRGYVYGTPAVTTLLAAGEGNLWVGEADGSVQSWNGTSMYQFTAPQKENDGTNNEVRAMSNFQGGVAVAFDDGSVDVYDIANRTWYQSSPTGRSITDLVPFQQTFFTIDTAGAIRQGNTSSYNDIWEGDGYTGKIATYKDGIIAAYSNNDTWTYSPENGWSSNFETPEAATSITVLNNNQVVIGTASGAVYESKANEWGTALRAGTLSDRPVTGLAISDTGQVYVGFDNGVVARSSGEFMPATVKWTSVRSINDLLKSAFTPDALKNAVNYANSGGAVFGAGDPLYNSLAFRPKCRDTNSCDANGTFYQIEMAGTPESIGSVSVPLGSADTTQTLDLSFDSGVTTFGYIYVPNGLWDKLDTDLYSLAVTVALTTGPSFNLNLGANPQDGNFEYRKTLAEFSKSFGPFGPGILTLTAGLDAGANVTLALPDGFDKDKLSAYAYLTGGAVVAYNTSAADWNADWNYYTDVSWQDFAQVEGITIAPFIEPSISADYGLTIPAGAPFEGYSLATVGMQYSNPFTANLTLAKGQDPSLTLQAQGILGFSAGLIPDITDALTFGTDFTLYDVQTDNLI